MRKQIVVEGHKSDWYEQAVFVLKDTNDKKVPNNLLAYADDIAERQLKTGNYREARESQEILNKTNNNFISRQAEWIDDFMYISLGVLAIMLISYFIF